MCMKRSIWDAVTDRIPYRVRLAHNAERRAKRPQGQDQRCQPHNKQRCETRIGPHKRRRVQLIVNCIKFGGIAGWFHYAYLIESNEHVNLSYNASKSRLLPIEFS